MKEEKEKRSRTTLVEKKLCQELIRQADPHLPKQYISYVVERLREKGLEYSEKDISYVRSDVKYVFQIALAIYDVGLMFEKGVLKN